ncbi:MAG: hypothetical protein NVS4B7_10310 [Ktedonobacteraceae bacterium]
MSDSELESYESDAEIEIVDLDAFKGQRKNIHTSIAAASSRLSLRSQLSLRQRVLRLAVTASVLMLMLVLVLSSIAPLRSAATRLLTRIVPTPTPDVNTEYFYFDASPSWGTLSVDGQTMKHPAVMGLDDPLYLASGRHRLVWRAEPFQPQSCLLRVPVSSDSSTGSCRAVSAQQHMLGPIHPTRDNSWQILFYNSLSTLPTVQRAALIQATQSALDVHQSTETVYPGEQYLIGGGHTIATAKQALHALLHFQLDTPAEAHFLCATDASTCSFGGQNQFQKCLEFCTQPNSFGYTDRAWYAIGIMHALWNYTTLDGQNIARNQLAAMPGAYAPVHPDAELQISWDGKNWHVLLTNEGVGAPHLVCQSANDAMNASPSLIDALSGKAQMGVSVNFAAGSVDAQGCLLIVQAIPANPTTPFPSSSASTAAYCLYRFGVLHAANKLAHHFWPSMLLADVYERGLARQWAALLKY